MDQNIDLRKIEKKTWRSTLEDGVMDIYLGIMILGMGLGVTLSNILPEPLDSMIGIIFIVIGLIFFLLAKKFITQRRLGYVKFGRQRKDLKIKTVIILIINLIALLIIYIIRLTNPEIKSVFPVYLDGLFIGLLFITIPLCFAAYFLQFNRLYFIAVLVGLSFFLSDVFSIFLPEPFDALIAFNIVSGTIICEGIVFLIRFIRKYPIPKEEMA
ncbi:MAG: hypothetical protein ACW972_04905 [Promethearchaeota archaeon]|jgi:hypothetical protein